MFIKHWLWRLSAIAWTFHMFIGLKWGEYLAKRWDGKQPTNCILWALHEKESDGGMLRLLDSRYGKWFHCHYIRKDGEAWEWNPNKAKTRFRLVRVGLPPPIFEGKPHKVKDISGV